MTYAISDIHGCYDKYIKMLEKIDLNDNDTLYVLGDVIDRGEGGIAVLQDMMKRKNIIPLIGNHEHSALRLLKNIALSPAVANSIRDTRQNTLWMFNGGEPTEKSFCALRNDEQQKIISYIESFPVRAEITVGGKSFHFSHTLPEYDEYNSQGASGKISDFDYMYGEPDYDMVYDDNMFFITGHTPTELIDPSYKGRIYQKHNHIAIDCGAVFGYPLGCLCLDTMEEIYVE